MQKTLLLFLLTLFSTGSFAQKQKWVNYSSQGNLIKTIGDDGDLLWLGTGQPGQLVKFNKISKELTFIEKNFYRFPEKVISTIAMDTKGVTWMGTQGGGLVKLYGLQSEIYNTANSSLPDNRIFSIVIDSLDVKWIATGSGLVKFDGKKWTIYTNANSGLPSDNVSILAFDKKNKLWVGTSGGGLAKFDGTNWEVFTLYNSGLHHNFILSLAIDQQNNKWIGTLGSGLVKFNDKDWFLYNSSNTLIPNNEIKSISIDYNENVWIGTPSGLGKFNGYDWEIYTMENSGLPSDNIHFIRTDDYNNKWIGTDTGFVKYDGENWEVFKMATHELPQIQVKKDNNEREGNEWVRTKTGNVSVFKENINNPNQKLPIFSFKTLFQMWDFSKVSGQPGCIFPMFRKLGTYNVDKQSMAPGYGIQQNSKLYSGMAPEQFRVFMDTLILTSSEEGELGHFKKTYTSGKMTIEIDENKTGKWETLVSTTDLALVLEGSCNNTLTGSITGTISGNKSEFLSEFSSQSKNNNFYAELEIKKIIPSTDGVCLETDMKFYPSLKEIKTETKAITKTGVPMEFKNSGLVLNFNRISKSPSEKDAYSTVNYNKDTIVQAPASEEIATIFSNCYWSIGSTMDSVNVDICFQVDTTAFNTSNLELLSVAYQSQDVSSWKLIGSKPTLINNKICFTVDHLSNWAIALSKPDESDKGDFTYFNDGKTPTSFLSETNGLSLSIVLKPGKGDTLNLKRYDINPGGNTPAGIVNIVKCYWEVKSSLATTKKVQIQLSKISGSVFSGKERILYRPNPMTAWSEIAFTRAQKGNQEFLSSLIFSKTGDFTLGVSKETKALFKCHTPSAKITAGNTVSFTVDVTNGQPPFLYKWQGENGFSSTRQSPKFNYEVPGNFSFSILVTDANGAESSCSNIVKVLPLSLPSDIMSQIAPSGKSDNSDSTNTGPIIVKKQNDKWDKSYLKERKGRK